MKRVLVILTEEEFKIINKVKEQNGHTWEQVLWAYADTFKEETE